MAREWDNVTIAMFCGRAHQKQRFSKRNKRKIKFTSRMESGGNINQGKNSNRHPSQAPWVRQLALPWKQDVTQRHTITGKSAE
jgi:hypothetical protein